MTPTDLLTTALAAVSASTAALALATVALNQYASYVGARRAARDARWEPVLLDALVGAVAPAVFADGFATRHHRAALELAAVYAARLDGESLDRLGEAMAPAMPLARALVRSRRPDRRALAVRLLGLLGTDADRPALVAALGDASPHVAMAAARALALQQDPRDADALVAALSRFDAWGTNAVASMLTLYGLAASPALLRGFADPAVPGPTRIACAEALRRMGSLPAAQTAAGVVRTTDDAELTAAALRLLRDVGGPARAAAVRPLLESPNEVIRLHAVSALAAISQHPDDAARIEHALSDPSPWVAHRAARGLIESGRAASLRALAAGDDGPAQTARQALAEAGLAETETAPTETALADVGEVAQTRAGQSGADVLAAP